MGPRLTAAVLTAAAAASGALGTRPDSDWYHSLDKPAWQPPGPAFPLVWTPLYGLIAWGSGRALERAASVSPAARRRLTALLAADLAANAGWCWVFFARRSPAGGVAVVVGLDALDVALLRATARHDRTATVALVPYALWTGFATALTCSIWRRNR